MKTTRKRYSADFKAKVALEAIRVDLTLAELAAKHGVHHSMIASWKRQAIEGMANTFSGAVDAARAVSESEVDKLHAKIGQLVVERDFLGSGSVIAVVRRCRSLEGFMDLSALAEPEAGRAVSGLTEANVALTRRGLLGPSEHLRRSFVPAFPRGTPPSDQL